MCLAIRLNCPPETELTAHRQKEEASVWSQEGNTLPFSLLSTLPLMQGSFFIPLVQLSNLCATLHEPLILRLLWGIYF
jgi:hypothetical protein